MIPTSRNHDHATENEALPGGTRGHEGDGCLGKHVQTRGLEASLIDLVKTRAFTDQRMCVLHPHTRDARGRGETEERLYLLDAWHESPLYSEREQAALAWTGSSLIWHVPDTVYDEPLTNSLK